MSVGYSSAGNGSIPYAWPAQPQTEYDRTLQRYNAAGGQGAVTMQQGAAGPVVDYMPRPRHLDGIPPGLEYLTQLDQILIHQRMEIFEIMTGIEMQNQYEIKNVLGQQIYHAQEKSDAMMRQCCHNKRGFVMHITDQAGFEVIRVRREFKCCLCWSCLDWFCCAFGCCSCCRLELQVEAPVGQICGYIRQASSCGGDRLEILDADGQRALNITGPACICECWCCPTDKKFRLMSADGGQQIGNLTKQWGGLYMELVTNADKFSATFPQDLDVRMKAVIIGAVFMIDFMYFEQKKGGSRRGRYY